MSFHAAAAAIDLVNVTATEKLILIILGSYADEGNRLWASQVTLSEKSRLSERTVRTTLATLEEREFIVREARYAKGERSSDLITLNFVPAKTAGTVFEPKAYRQLTVSEPATGAVVPATIAGNPIKEPIKESPSLSAGERERVKIAAGDALADMARSPGIASMMIFNGLLAADPPCTFDDIEHAVWSAAAWHRARDGPGSMKSWTLARDMSLQNRDARLKGLPPPNVQRNDDSGTPGPYANGRQSRADISRLAAARTIAERRAARNGGGDSG